MAQDTVGATTYYLATGGAGLFYEPVGADSWTQVSLPGPRVGSIGALTSGSTTLLFAVTGDDNDNNALYATVGDFRSPWTKVAITNGENPISLVPVLANDVKTVLAYILVTQLTGGTDAGSYENFYLLTPAASVPATTGTFYSLLNTSSNFVAGNGVGYPILAASCDQASFTGNVYLMSGTNVWTASVSGGGLGTPYILAGLPSQIWGAMAYVGAGGPGGLPSAGLLLGDAEQGNLYFGSVSNPGTSTDSWTQISQLVSSARNSYSMVFHFNSIGVSRLGSALFLGSVKSGMGQIQGGAFTAPPTSTTVSTSSWGSTLLESNGIQMFFTGTNGDLFLGTNGYGLWIQASDGSFSLQ
ncbi:MAG: hypothetical protein HKM06_01605 [Spirochaetales bacterium]|nr:hypothetical protein [Spirochaetales bacterium]